MIPSWAHDVFQSTPLTRGETPLRCVSITPAAHFNPLPSHEGRLHPRPAGRLASVISIHSPHTRGDATKKSATWRAQPFQSTPLTRGETTVGSASPGARLFQSTPLTRGETLTLQVYSHITVISIHSPHTRGDDRSGVFCSPPNHFNPLPSHEGRQERRMTRQRTHPFQSTPLTRGETWACRMMFGGNTGVFQSTPLTRGETGVDAQRREGLEHFNPLPSHEGRLR